MDEHLLAIIIGGLIAGGFRFVESIVVKALPRKFELGEDDHHMLKDLYTSDIRFQEVLKSLMKLSEQSARENQEVVELLKKALFNGKGRDG